MPNFQLPKTTALKVSGAVPGAKANFFLSGTSTPEPVFADRDLTIPLGVTVIADGDARFPPIYQDPEKSYKLVLNDADDVLIYETDPVEPLALAGEDITARIRQIATTPLDFGAVGDGVADETIFVQQAIDEASYSVDLVGLTYRCDGQLNIPSNRRFSNGNIDSANLTDTFAISLSGALTAITTTLTANAPVGSVSVTVGSTASFSPGDLVWIRSPSVTWATGITIAEIMKISVINSSTMMTFDSALSATYPLATSSVTLIQPVSNVVIENVRITGSGVGAHSGIGMSDVEKVRIRNSEISNFGANGMSISRSNDVECGVEISEIVSHGFVINDSSTRILLNGFSAVNCAGSGVLIGTAGGGINKLNATQNGIINGCGEGVTLGSGSFRCAVTGCSVAAGAIGMQTGISDNGASNIISGNGVGGASFAGIFHELGKSSNFTTVGGLVDTPSFTATGNEISFCTGTAIRFQDNVNSVDMSGININENRINAITGDGISVLPSFSILKNVNCLTNSVDQCTGIPINFTGGANGEINAFSIFNNNATRYDGVDGIRIACDPGKFTTGTVSTNIVETTLPVTSAIHTINLRGSSIFNNTCSGGVNGLFAEWTTGSSGDVSILTNVFRNFTGTDIRIFTNTANVSNILVNNNLFFSGSATNALFVDLPSGGSLIRFTANNNTAQGNLQNNIFISGATGSSFTDANISNNVCTIAALGGNIVGQFDSGSVVNSIIVSGNNTLTGADGNIVFTHAGGGAALKIINNTVNATAGGNPNIKVENFSITDIKNNTCIGSVSDAILCSYLTGGPLHVSICGNSASSTAGSTVRVQVGNSQTLSYLDVSGNHGTAIPGDGGIVIDVSGSGQVSRFVCTGNNITGTLFDWSAPPAPATATAAAGLLLRANATARINSFNVSGNNFEFLANGVYMTGLGTIQGGLITGNHFIRGDVAIRRDVSTFDQIFAGANFIDQGNHLTGLVGVSSPNFDAVISSTSADLPNFFNS